jgi:hypothetical protein
MCIKRVGKRFRNLIVVQIIILIIEPKGGLETFQVSILIRSLGTEWMGQQTDHSFQSKVEDSKAW